MWRRLQTLAPALRRTATAAASTPAAPAASACRTAPLSTAAAAFRRTSPLLSGDKPATVEDVMPIAAVQSAHDMYYRVAEYKTTMAKHGRSLA